MTTQCTDLTEHEAKAAAEKRLGMLIRPMIPQPHPDFLKRGVCDVVPQWPMQDGVRWFMADGLSELVPSPFVPGTVLHCREIWDWQDRHQGSWTIEDFERNGGNVRYKADRVEPFEKWIPARKMPDRAIRFRPTVGEVTCKRAHDLDEGDAIAWCVPSLAPGDEMWDRVDSLEQFFNSIHGPSSWERNPWVWLATLTN